MNIFQLKFGYRTRLQLFQFRSATKPFVKESRLFDLQWSTFVRSNQCGGALYRLDAVFWGITQTCLLDALVDRHRFGKVDNWATMRFSIRKPVVSKYLWKAAEDAKAKYSSICGVPYTALPIATIMSVDYNVPMLIRRREAKDYGTKKMIEGHYKQGDVCLVVEDVVTSGSSVYETVKTLNEYGLEVEDAVVLLERQQGGTERLLQDGIRLHSVLTMTELIQTLFKHEKIDKQMYEKVQKFIAENKFEPTAPLRMTNGTAEKKSKMGMSFSERAEHCENSVTRRLFTLMDEKQSNLVLSVDLTKSDDILKLVDQVGHLVCMVKTHVDIIEDFTEDFCKQLSQLADKHNFLIFEDRKFADIGNTVKHQFSGGMYKIGDWAHIVNAHSVPGGGVIEGLKQAGLQKERACLLIAQMSSAGSLAKGDYIQGTVKMAQEHSDFVIGFICQEQLCEDPKFIHMTPGVKLSGGGDGLGQQYVTPRDAIVGKKSDIIIVGRGITSLDPLKEAEAYRSAAYSAYQERVAQ